MLVTFQRKTDNGNLVFKDVLWVQRKVSDDGYVICFVQLDKPNKIIFDAEYIFAEVQ